jgi:7,8-dihydro-6-hydroxymethylpterin dimethyltransferase
LSYGAEVKQGCPYDCGLCSEHEQHTCIGLLEIT